MWLIIGSLVIFTHALCPEPPLAPVQDDPTQNVFSSMEGAIPDAGPSAGEQVCVKSQYYRFCAQTGKVIYSDMSEMVCQHYFSSGYDFTPPSFSPPDWKRCHGMFGGLLDEYDGWMVSCAEAYYSPLVVSGFLLWRTSLDDTSKCLVVSVTDPSKGHWNDPATSFSNETCLNEPSITVDGSCPLDPIQPTFPEYEDPTWTVAGSATGEPVCVRLQYYRVCRDSGRLVYGPLGDDQCHSYGGMDASGNAYHVPHFKSPNIFNSSDPSIPHSELGVRRRAPNVAYNTYDVDGYILYRVANGSTAPPSCIVSAGENPEDATWAGAAVSFQDQKCLPGPQHYPPMPTDGEAILMDAEAHEVIPHPPPLLGDDAGAASDADVLPPPPTESDRALNGTTPAAEESHDGHSGSPPPLSGEPGSDTPSSSPDVEVVQSDFTYDEWLHEVIEPLHPSVDAEDLSAHLESAAPGSAAVNFSSSVYLELRFSDETSSSFTMDKQIKLKHSIATVLNVDASRISMKFFNAARRRLVLSNGLVVDITVLAETEVAASALQASVKQATFVPALAEECAAQDFVVFNSALSVDTGMVRVVAVTAAPTPAPEALLEGAVLETVQAVPTPAPTHATDTETAWHNLFKLAYDTELHATLSELATARAHKRVSEDSTSTCSHVFCVYKPVDMLPGRHSVRVHNHNDEIYGSKHVCAKDLHEEGRCGCECYDEGTGEGENYWDAVLSAKAKEKVRRAQPTLSFAPTVAPSPAPTVQVTAAPTAAPTSAPTTKPTQTPTPHPCDDGSHGCDKFGGVCYQGNYRPDHSEDELGTESWSCGCQAGYWCSAGCEEPHVGHTCVLVTAAPTNTPTSYPTAEPTTQFPTTVPTVSPTGSPTDAPTSAPTASPTEPSGL